MTLFIASRWTAPSEPNSIEAQSNRSITIGTAQQNELRSTFLEQMGRAPTEGEFRGMLSADIDEEILYREALARGLVESDGGVKTRLIQKMLFLEGGAEIEDAAALLERAQNLGLHEGDLVVRRILVQKMRLLASSLEPDAHPNEQDIQAAYRAQSEALRAPDRRSITHLFFSADRRPDSARTDAKQMRETLTGKEALETISALGDPFPLGHVFQRRSERDLERSFGAQFGPQTFSARIGAWSQPIESAYGFHLVRVDDAESGQIPPLERVRDQLLHQLEQERREERLETLLSELRTRYEIVLAAPADSAGPPNAGLSEALKESR